MDDLIVGDLVIFGSDLEERFDTPGGPGGQHANRTASAVTLRLDLEASAMSDGQKKRLMNRYGNVIEVRASESRSQHLNRKIARDRLAERIEVGLRDQKERTPTKPSPSSKEQRLSEKKARSQIKRSRQKPDLDD